MLYGTIGLRPRSVEAGLLQRSTRRSPSVDISAVATCYESCSIWSHVTTSVPVYVNCTGCQSLNEWHMALPYRPQRSSRTSAGLHYWLTSASHHPTTSSRSSLRAASRGDYVVPRTNRRFADRTFPLLHHGRGINCRLILKWHNYNVYIPSGTEDFSFPSRLQLRIMRVVMTLYCNAPSVWL